MDSPVNCCVNCRNPTPYGLCSRCENMARKAARDDFENYGCAEFDTAIKPKDAEAIASNIAEERALAYAPQFREAYADEFCAKLLEEFRGKM